MGSMSASDAAPLPRLGEVFFDVRGESRSMRLSWYANTGVAVFSIWQGGTCTGTFRLPIADLPRMVEALQNGPGGRAEGVPDLAAGSAPGRRGPVRPAALPELLDSDIETGQTTAAIHLPLPEPGLAGYHAQAQGDVRPGAEPGGYIGEPPAAEYPGKPRRRRRDEMPPAGPRTRPSRRERDKAAAGYSSELPAPGRPDPLGAYRDADTPGGYGDEPPTAYFPGQPAGGPDEYLGQPGETLGGGGYPGDYRDAPPGPGTYPGDPLAPGYPGDFRDVPPGPGSYPGDPLAPGHPGGYRDVPPGPGTYPGDPLEPDYPGDYREPPGPAYPGEGDTGPYPGEPGRDYRLGELGRDYRSDPLGGDHPGGAYLPEGGYQGFPPELPASGGGSRARPYVDGPPEAEDDAYESDRGERGQRRKPRGRRRAEPAPDSFPYGPPPGGREPRQRGRDPGRH